MDINLAWTLIIVAFVIGYIIGKVNGYNKGYNDSPSHDEWFNEE
jgi:hypothetical protein